MNRAHGQQDGKTRFFQPLIVPARKTPVSLSFWNLIELYVLRALRRTHDRPMPKVGRRCDTREKSLAHVDPSSRMTFYTDGINERLALLIDTSDGQTASSQAHGAT